MHESRNDIDAAVQHPFLAGWLMHIDCQSGLMKNNERWLMNIDCQSGLMIKNEK